MSLRHFIPNLKASVYNTLLSKATYNRSEVYIFSAYSVCLGSNSCQLSYRNTFGGLYSVFLHPMTSDLNSMAIFLSLRLKFTNYKTDAQYVEQQFLIK